MRIQGIYVGRAFTRDQYGTTASPQAAVQMLAAIKDNEARVFLVQSGALSGHSSFTLMETVKFGGHYRYPFYLFAGETCKDLFESLVEYYLWAGRIHSDDPEELGTVVALCVQSACHIIHARTKDITPNGPYHSLVPKAMSGCSIL